MGNLIKEMKERIAKSGTSKKEILYFGKDSSHRVRFLQELDSGEMFKFHNDYNAHIYELCKDPENGEDCDLCKDSIATQDTFVWSVWDYDSSSVRLLHMKATGISPVPTLIEMYEEFGTIMDRDYKIKKVGSGMGGSFTVVALNKEKFRTKAKPMTRKQIQEIFEKAFIKSEETDSDDDDEDEDDEPKTKKKGKASKSKEKSKEKSKSKKKKHEPTVREQYEELDFDDIKEIALEIGMTKKEIKHFDDSDELLDELFDNYEEDDLKEMLDDLGSDEEEDEDEDED